MGIITEKDVVISLKEKSLMTEAYVIDRYIDLLNKPMYSSFIKFVLSFKDENKIELEERIEDVIRVNYRPAINYIKQNIK